MEQYQWEFGAPADHHCCNYMHDFDDTPLATWTLLNPADGGDPLYYCDDCHIRIEANNGR